MPNRIVVEYEISNLDLTMAERRELSISLSVDLSICFQVDLRKNSFLKEL